MQNILAINTFRGPVYGRRSFSVIDDNVECLWSFWCMQQVPPRKRKQSRVFHTICQAQCSSQIGLLDEHGLSNLCHRCAAIYISVRCSCFVSIRVNRNLHQILSRACLWNRFSHFSTKLHIFWCLCFANWQGIGRLAKRLRSKKRKNIWSMLIFHDRVALGFVENWISRWSLLWWQSLECLLKSTHDKYIKNFACTFECCPKVQNAKCSRMIFHFNWQFHNFSTLQSNECRFVQQSTVKWSIANCGGIHRNKLELAHNEKSVAEKCGLKKWGWGVLIHHTPFTDCICWWALSRS